jgi:hypothetical protein
LLHDAFCRLNQMDMCPTWSMNFIVFFHYIF